jgi:multisubunit Na+/H+ antiporter MnhE subunit
MTLYRYLYLLFLDNTAKMITAYVINYYISYITRSWFHVLLFVSKMYMIYYIVVMTTAILKSNNIIRNIYVDMVGDYVEVQYTKENVLCNNTI